MGVGVGVVEEAVATFSALYKKVSEFVLEHIHSNKKIDDTSYLTHCTPSRTPRISGLKSQILKPTFLS